MVSLDPPSKTHSDFTQLRHNDRLSFPPSYAIVGLYRLLSDPNLRTPIWAKCKHGLIRGGIVGILWAATTYDIQLFIVSRFLIKSPKVTGLASDSLFGFAVPVATYATVLFVSSQVTTILRFFLSKNIKIARERAWDQTVASRGKPAEFWGPYVEEWEIPPKNRSLNWEKWFGGWIGRYIIRKVILVPLNFYPVVGIFVSAGLKAISTARHLHKPYFKVKNMSPEQVAVFIEERKWDYRAFGFVSVLLESLPIIGLGFTISNRIGAAMWAFDLEKRQNLFRSGQLKPLPPVFVQVDGRTIVGRPAGTGLGSGTRNIPLGLKED